MTQTNVQLQIPFESLVEAISALNLQQKQELWQVLNLELHQTKNRECTEPEIKQAIALESQKQLEELNPEYRIGWSETGDIPKPYETIKFGDLPLKVQSGIREGLASAARGELESWEVK